MEKNDNVEGLFNAQILESRELSSEEFKEYLKTQVQKVLDQEFSNVWQKRKMKVCRDRIQCACPVCSDSMKDLSKKRGNFILSGKFAGKYKCFNCGAFMSFNKFFERYNQSLSLEAIDYLSSHQSELEYNPNHSFASSINYIYEEELVDAYALDKQAFANMFGLLTCSKEDFHTGVNYLKSRYISRYENFLFEPKRQLLFVLNLTNSGKIIGFQIRKLKAKKGEPKYLTYSLKSIYKNFLKKETDEIPDFLDTLSMMFNIFQINLNAPILVTEGPLDAFLLPNAIATTGANKNIMIHLPYWFVYDSDKTGNRLAIEKLESGFKVFLWDKLKKEYALPKRNKWDINDVIIYCVQNNLRIPNWKNYFSNGEWDILDI